ncbi:uncharacterized protein M421DRAFT_397302 [Didymella exigua CBS 183.55]|uniref:Uncharacterized protein n=1 Tax=Didymella exigua CBS 183.55 TaxID=1150837 RepID=A0A6A5REV8_9PLEO|nr:uncharacterized protein M421DRAFT_397302 [Didymella exigua CBS 183.55]KAF1926043.1 hypothetical protein M421DRAFT_397302 [Didymella exigua CBS 183.55]
MTEAPADFIAVLLVRLGVIAAHSSEAPGTLFTVASSGGSAVSEVVACARSVPVRHDVLLCILVHDTVGGSGRFRYAYAMTLKGAALLLLVCNSMVWAFIAFWKDGTRRRSPSMIAPSSAMSARSSIVFPD